VSRYPLAKQGVFRTVQGEGALLGEPMVFIRLAGCSVGCPLCDTDYKVAERVDVGTILDRAGRPGPGARRAWVTGGEPTDHDLGPLLSALDDDGWRVALATSGHRAVPYEWAKVVDWLSVSPHDPAKWVQAGGQELKLVPGLNGFGLGAFAEKVGRWEDRFQHCFVSPCEGRPESVAECVGFVSRNPRWLMTVQAHKVWGIS
jgi:7-carboxy-7-deazaguanine synthase